MSYIFLNKHWVYGVLYDYIKCTKRTTHYFLYHILKWKKMFRINIKQFINLCTCHVFSTNPDLKSCIESTCGNISLNPSTLFAWMCQIYAIEKTLINGILHLHVIELIKEWRKRRQQNFYKTKKESWEIVFNFNVRDKI